MRLSNINTTLDIYCTYFVNILRAINLTGLGVYRTVPRTAPASLDTCDSKPLICIFPLSVHALLDLSNPTYIIHAEQTVPLRNSNLSQKWKYSTDVRIFNARIQNEIFKKVPFWRVTIYARADAVFFSFRRFIQIRA